LELVPLDNLLDLLVLLDGEADLSCYFGIHHALRALLLDCKLTVPSELRL